jgi:hypothetical protein
VTSEGSVSDDTGTRIAGNVARRPPGYIRRVRGRDRALVLAVIAGGATEPRA